MDQTVAEPGSPTDVLTAAFYRFSDAGLRLPPIPRTLLDSLHEYDAWRIGTRDVHPADRLELATEAADPATPDQIVFGHVGQGVANWWICCRLISGPLAVFIRHPFGGAYGDREAEASQIESSFYRLEELIVRADAARLAGRLAPTERLFVIQDSQMEPGWQILGRAGDLWRPTRDPIGAAIRALTEGEV